MWTIRRPDSRVGNPDKDRREDARIARYLSLDDALRPWGVVQLLTSWTDFPPLRQEVIVHSGVAITAFFGQPSHRKNG